MEREKKFHEAESHRHKMQVNSTSNTNGALVLTEQQSNEYNVALKQYKEIELELKQSKQEILELKQQSGSSSESKMKSNTVTRLNTRSSTNAANSNTNSNSANNTNSTSISIEQIELADKRISQLTQERRELLSKNLEENKEKMEISQKYLLMERELNSNKSKMTKLVLEKERLERRLDKATSTSGSDKGGGTKSVLSDRSNQI